MNKLLLIVLFWGCTQKYADYDLIRKVDFNQESFMRPVTLTQVVPAGKDALKECFHQWLFFSNAEKEKEAHLKTMVQLLCPHHDFLYNAHFTQRWWTTIIYTQSCISIETQCAGIRSKQ